MKIILITAIVLAMGTSPTQLDRGYRDWSKYPLELSCEGSDWPAYCEAHKRDR